MTTICDDGDERQAIDAGLGADPSPGEITTELVGDGGIVPAWTLRRDGDVHTAIVHGLAQYVWTMRTAIGRLVEFTRVTEEAADAWDEATAYPVAAVYGDGEDGTYEAPVRTPVQLAGADRQPLIFREPDGQSAGLFEVATYQHRRLVVAVWCDSKPQQSAIASALEDLWAPTLAMSGFSLRLGHYHGAVARYLVTGQGRDNSAAADGTWGLRFRLTATAPTIRVHRRPLAIIRPVPTVGPDPVPA